MSTQLTLLATTLLALAPPIWVQREAVLMGTTLVARVAAPSRPEAIEAISAAFEAVGRVDSLLNTWRDDSELARLNHAPPNQATSVSPDLATLLDEAAEWTRATEGAFDPGVGALVDAWDLRGVGRVPTEAELARARAATGIAQFAFEPAGRCPHCRRSARRLAGGSWLDSGGFGKGVALREVQRELARRGIRSALLNFGGQVLALGTDRDRREWDVPVAHPARRAEVVARLRVRDRSVATSSQSERFIEVAGRRYGHVLDPRTGRPVPAWGSVTVVAEDPVVADILSTALFVLGPDAGLAWAWDRPEVGVLFLIDDRGTLQRRWNPAMEVYLLDSRTHQPRRPSVAGDR